MLPNKPSILRFIQLIIVSNNKYTRSGFHTGGALAPPLLLQVPPRKHPTYTTNEVDVI